MRKHNIITYYTMTNTPERDWDWTAALYGYSGIEENNNCCGFGSTEIDSIKDLLQKLSNVEDIKQ